MTDHTIETLKTQRPRVEYTRRERVQRGIGRVLLAVSLMLGSFAVSTTYRVAACTNTNLGQRSAPSSADYLAHIDFADAVLTALTYPPTNSTAEQRRRFNKLVADVKAYKAQLVADQATRVAHPLGKC